MLRVALVLTLALCAPAGCVPQKSSPPNALPPASEPVQPATARGLAGEWEPVEHLLISWADQSDDLAAFFADVIAAALGEVEVTLLTGHGVDVNPLYTRLSDRGIDSRRLRVERTPVDTMWIRDYGPLVVRTEAGRQVMDFAYSEDRPADDRLPSVMAKNWGLPVRAVPFDLDGGHIQADGAGRCIVSDSAFLAESKISPRVESEMWASLGCDEISIVPSLADEATGHVDMFAYVTGPGRVIVGRYSPGEDDENAALLDEAAVTLTDAGFHVSRVPMPGNSSRQVFRTYTNALALNDIVLVPVYDEDSKFEYDALTVFAGAFPGRRIIPVPSDEIIQLAGAVHCVTMTSPRQRSSVENARRRVKNG